MKSQLRSFPNLLTIILALSFLIFTSPGGGEEFIAPVPDKSKTLSANDGGPDGCGSSRFDCVMGGYNYWSSTESKDESKSAWVVSFYIGKIYENHKLMDATFWPVRDVE